MIAIASELETLDNSVVIPQDKISQEWQEKISQAIASNKLPQYLIYPQTQEAVSEVVKLASKDNLKIMPCGNGSKLNWGGLVTDSDLVISTKYLNRIIEHATGDLTVTVEAGVTLAQLQDTLKLAGQFLPIDASYRESATIGGIVATGDSGSWRQRYGGVRDMLLGITFVRADGEIAKAGGRVVKNVAGYDLMKLLTGSYGSLGIITQVTFRVYPQPKASTTVLLTGESNAISVAASTIVKSGLTPTVADLLSKSLVESLDRKPSMGLLLRCESIPESVKDMLGKFESVAQQLGLNFTTYSDTDETCLWEKLQQVTEKGIKCKIGVLPSAAVEILNQFNDLGIIHISSGLGRIIFNSETGINEIKKMRRLCESNKGFLTVLEAPSQLKQSLEPWGYTGNALEIMRKLKAQFDSKNLLNSGKFVV